MCHPMASGLIFCPLRYIFKLMKRIVKIAGCCLLLLQWLPAPAQNYVTPTGFKPQPGPHHFSYRLVSEHNGTKTYVLVFGKHEELIGGLTAFATEQHVRNARFTAIGDADSAKVGWYDRSRKQFKVITIAEPAEITSLIGDIAIYNDKPVVHAHINLATADGLVHGGHLLEAFIFPTLELMLTTEDTPLYKQLDEESQAALINPALR